MSDRVVVFGAGATGRAHVGLLCRQAGYDLVFVDRNPVLVRSLAAAGGYTVRLYGTGYHEVRVEGYQVFHAEEREAIAAEIAGAALVLTAVFDQNLPDVARTIAMGVAACRRAGRSEPLNCIACENMMDSSSVLGRHVLGLLSGEDLAYCKSHFAFPDSMISRVVPRPEAGSLLLIAEDYNEWTARAASFKGTSPLAALELVEDQTARLERKLFIHNGGHAICGYMGYHRGHRFIHEAVADPVVGRHVLGALDELGEVVRRKHGFSAESLDAYKQDLVRRGAVPEMRDEILRVVRDPLRKLSPRERLVAPAQLAVEYGLPRRWLVKGIVAALKYHHPGDAQSRLLAAKLDGLGLTGTLVEVCGIEPGSDLADEIAATWEVWPD